MYKVNYSAHKLQCAYLLHCVLHKLVNILVVLNGILIVEVTAKCEHDVISSEVASLQENVFDEGIHTLIDIVIKEVGIILKERDKLIATIPEFHHCPKAP